MCHEEINEIEDVKVSLKVDSSHVAVEENGEADCPNTGCVPPMPKSVLHDSESTCLVAEFLYIWWAVRDKQASKYLRTEYNDALISLREQI
jgi:hypothetical protein